MTVCEGIGTGIGGGRSRRISGGSVGSGGADCRMISGGGAGGYFKRKIYLQKLDMKTISYLWWTNFLDNQWLESING
jgi:hypothetical protein